MKLIKLFCLLLLGSCGADLVVAGEIVLENQHYRYSIEDNGKNLAFVDKASGKNYLSQSDVSYCASIVLNGKKHPVSKVQYNTSGYLKLDFAPFSVSVSLKVHSDNDAIFWEIAEVKGNVESLVFLDIPLDLQRLPSEPFAACALALNIKTEVEQLPALQNYLHARAHSRFGMAGARIAVIGIPQPDILAAIRNVISNAKDIPASTAGGAWAQLSKEGYGSYLMNFGTLTEKNADEWVGYCKSVGFNQIDHHGGNTDFFLFGSFELNKEKWPDGWSSFKRLNDKLHQGGISSIFHTYAFFIDKQSSLVTPVPHPDLASFRTFTLAEPLSISGDEIVVNESTADISLFTGFHFPNSLILRIGNELIEFSGVSKTIPYKFTGCKRGVNGTKASGHEKGQAADHLKELFGRFVPGPETKLFDEVAKRTADIVNDCGFDGIYFDAIDGSDILDGMENYWYYSTKFLFAVASRLKKPVGMEMSAMSHFWWHYRSRWQAWDVPRRGYKKFVDIHVSSLKSEEEDHGYWRGHTPQFNRYAPLTNGGLLLPLHLGWWHHFTWDPPNTEFLFDDDIEYLGCKMIGNNAGLSMFNGYQKKDIKENPSFKRLNAIIKQYETLRQQQYFSEGVKRLLREPGKEYSLFKQDNGRWNFKPVTYHKHLFSGNEDSRKWKVQNEYAAQPLKVRIQAQMSVVSYDDPAAITVAAFTDPNEFGDKRTAKGVIGSIDIAVSDKERPGKLASFTAYSAGLSPRKGSWLKLEKKFEPWANLEKNKGLGVWVKGDGNGQLLNLRLETPEHLSAGVRGDHYIKVDFKGWKYFELVELESSEFTNYLWPGSEIIRDTKVKDLFVYKSYLHSVQYDKVDKLQLWYNNLPEGKEVDCIISPVKALPLVSNKIENPVVTVNGKKIIFPVTIESGMYLEFNSVADCKLYDSKGGFIKEVKPAGTAPALLTGENSVSFSCGGRKDIKPRVNVTVISKGKALSEILNKK
ncbi:MAG: hypothetical protein KF746_10875 [Chitinophagaceae bacterium]|nr:hypothetical protein [Chitinophagaceae bacterium]